MLVLFWRISKFKHVKVFLVIHSVFIKIARISRVVSIFLHIQLRNERARICQSRTYRVRAPQVTDKFLKESLDVGQDA